MWSIYSIFNRAAGVLQAPVITLGAGLGIGSVINLPEGYSRDTLGSNAYVWKNSAKEFDKKLAIP